MRDDKQYVVMLDGKELLTPGKKKLAVPTQALADAIVAEWKKKKSSSATRYVPSEMPLTALAFTAIDQVDDKKEQIIEVMLTYVDTDTLSYRAHGDEKLLRRQQAEWDPIVGWMSAQLGGIWQTTQGVMPMDQPQVLHEALRTKLEALSSMQLSGLSMLGSLCSSIALAYSVFKKQVSPEEAFRLSQLEEDTQAEQWGVDEEAVQRSFRIKEEIVASARFLRLLEAA